MCSLLQQGTSEHSATYWLLASLVIYAVGKTVATWLMNRLNPALLLGTFALAATALLLVAVFSSSMLAVYALILVSFCMAPCWPTNFGLVIKGMGKDTQTAGSIVVMSNYRRGRYSAGDGHYLGYERRQYANRLYRSAPVLCVCRFLRFLVRA